MRLLSVATFVLGVAASAAGAQAGTLKVPSDDYPTIQSAVDAAVEGDTILVYAGVYAETVTFFEKSGITLKGKGYPTIQPGAGNGIVISFCEGIVVSGLEVYQAITGVSIASSVDVSVSKMVVSGSTSDAFNLSGNLRVLISKCEVNGAADNGVEDNDSDDLIIEKCSFQGISSVAVYLSPYNLAGSGSDRAKVSKNAVNGASNGLYFGGADIVVEKNRVQVTGGYGIYFDSSTSPGNALITKNVVSTTGSDGIRAYGYNFEISRNRLTGGGITEYGNGHVLDRNAVTGGSYGVYVGGSGTTVTRNSIRESTGDGIVLAGYFLPVEGNKVWAIAGNGIVVNTGGQGPIAGNKVADCDVHGFLVVGGGNTFAGNKATACDAKGFFVTGTSNTFTGNKASGNGQLDLADTNAPGANTYTDNKFGTQAIPYVE